MSKLNSILVLTDFSAVSDTALDYAISLARLTESQLKVFHAYPIPMVLEPGLGRTTPIIQTEQQQAARQNLEEWVGQHEEIRHLTYGYDTKAGPLGDAVESLLKEQSFDLIVMGTKGAQGIKEYFLGTNTVEIVNTVDIPVLIIPQDYTYQPIRQIAFAYDHRGLEDPHRLDALAYIAKCAYARLHILNISSSEEVNRTEDLASLDTIDLQFNDIEHNFDVKIAADEEAGIREYVEEHNIQMLAVMPRRHSFFQKLFNRSFTNKIAYHTDIPLLVLQHA